MNDDKRKKTKVHILKFPYGVKLLRNLLMHGRSDLEICFELDIAPNTLRNWKRLNQEFCDFCNEWKSRAPEMAKRSLFMQAVGYEKSTPITNAEGEVIGHKTDWVPPNFNATKFLLLNKASDEYRDKLDIENLGNNQPVTIIFERKKKLPGLALPEKAEEKKDDV